MPAFSDLCTLAEARRWLQTGQNEFPVTDDGLLQRLITAASQYIQSWLNRPIASQDWLEVRDGQGVAGYDSRYSFAITPCTAVIQVISAGVTIPAIPPQMPTPPGIITPTFYTTQAGYLFSPTQLVIRGFWVPRLAQCLSIMYTAGYAQTPEDVRQACIEMVGLKYRERMRIGERTRSLGGGETASYQGPLFSNRDFASDIQAILQQYRMVAPIASYVQQAPTQFNTAVLVAAA